MHIKYIGFSKLIDLCVNGLFETKQSMCIIAKGFGFTVLPQIKTVKSILKFCVVKI